ncbi:hypothetical protein ACXR6G_13640 [Ancylomarina sp. YFZ004]
MKDRIQNGYSLLGIETKKNKVLVEFLNRMSSSNEILNRQFELFHMDFLNGLSNIKDFDKKSFDRYIEKINETKGELNFWGEKFEVYIHSKLIKANPDIINDLNRGVDGIEPDLIFKHNETQLGIELTTLKFVNPPKSKEIILSKITKCILEKNNKPYSNERCALLIDITNIIAYEKILNLNINEIIKELFKGFGYLNKEMNFGMIILCNSIFKQREDKTLYHSLNPRFGFLSETKPMNKDLKSFLDIFFNRFISDDNFHLGFHHMNM